MRKILPVLLVLALVPMSVYAAPEDTTGVRSGAGNSVADKRAEYQAKKDEIVQQKEQVQALILTKSEIKTQTKEQVQASKQEIKELKNQMKASFQSMKDLTPAEREELKGDISALKDEMKGIHSSSLALRDAAREDITSINEQINDIVSKSNLTEDEKDDLDNILEEL